MATYSNSKYGFRRRVVFPNVEAIGTAATHPDGISFPTKTKIYKFGIIAQDDDIRVSSDTVLDLLSDGATIGQFTFSSAAVIAATTDDSVTGKTLTATTVAADANLQGAVGVIGSAGNFQYYIDVQEQFAV